MRRPTRLGLAVVAVLLVLLGAYTAYWLIVAKRITDGVAAWARTERSEKIDVSWKSIGVAGFPFTFRLELENAVLRDGRLTPSPELRIPGFSPAPGPGTSPAGDCWRPRACLPFSPEAANGHR